MESTLACFQIVWIKYPLMELKASVNLKTFFVKPKHINDWKRFTLKLLLIDILFSSFLECLHCFVIILDSFKRFFFPKIKVTVFLRNRNIQSVSIIGNIIIDLKLFFRDISQLLYFGVYFYLSFIF